MSSVPPPSDDGLLPDTQRALLHRIAVAQSGGRAPSLAAAVVGDGALIWAGARGLGDDDEVGVDVQYRIGSITKTFVAVLVMRLRDEGRLDLADSLDVHLPGTQAGTATIAQLLSHTSGIASDSRGPWWERTPRTLRPDVAALLDDGATKHPPSRRYHYSNPAFAYLGAVVERHRGVSWDAALRDEVLLPLGLRRTTILPESPHAQGYAVHPWADVVQREPMEDTGRMAPAGQLWSTTGDLATFAAFLASGDDDVLRAASVEEMRTPTAPADPQDWHGSYGLGMRIQRRAERTFAGHGGSMPGFLAGLMFDVDSGIGAVTTCNTTSGVATTELAVDLIEVVLDREPPIPAPWRSMTALDDDVLALAGPWYWGPAVFAIHVNADRWLTLRRIDGSLQPARFRPEPDGTWTGLDGYHAGETLRVARGPNGSLSHIDIGTFVYSREPYDPSASIPGGTTGWEAMPVRPEHTAPTADVD